MNFFEHQDQARRNTKKLVFLFAAAVACLIAMTTLLVAAFLYYFQHHNNRRLEAYNSVDGGFPLMELVTWDLLGMISVVVIGVVLAGSWYKTRLLAGGGGYVAQQLGGRLVHSNSDDATEQRLLNVVAEMAIASGTPIPQVYLLQEDSINAFAAGTDVHNAAIGVTRGCAELLSRDELQGVIAHEFSHILHGDMSLNMRLTGVLHGILLIGLIGRVLASSNRHSGFRSRRSSNNNGAILGLGLMAIGYGGTLFGQLIKSAVSRQREFLADAAAVQFTRNPAGISGALQKIGGLSSHAHIRHPNREEFSHLFFGAAFRSALGSLTATHPPLEVRIKRIDPDWQETFPQLGAATYGATANSAQVAGFNSATGNATTAITDAPVTLEDAIELVGETTPAQIGKVRQMLEEIPDTLRTAARDAYSARAIIYSLLISGQPRQEACWALLKQHAHPVSFKFCQQIFTTVDALSGHQRLPMFELCLPALLQMSAPQTQVFQNNVVRLIKADGEVAIFEWALYRLLKNRLSPNTNDAEKTVAPQHAKAAIQQLLSTIAHAGNDTPEQAQQAYEAGTSVLKLANRPLQPREHSTLPMLDSSLQQLRQLPPLKKPALLKAIAATIHADGDITPGERELFRAIADCLDCPMPPLTTAEK